MTHPYTCEHRVDCPNSYQHQDKLEAAVRRWYRKVGLEPAAGVQLPRLNSLLLQDVVNWASRSYLGQLQENEPGHNQENWGYKAFSRLRSSLPRRKNLPVVKEDQNYCGTTYCIAGYSAQLTENLVWPKHRSDIAVLGPDEISAELGKTLHTFNHGTLTASRRYLGAADEFDWIEGGALILGLTLEEAQLLFAGDNSIREVRKIAGEIADSRGHQLCLIPLEK